MPAATKIRDLGAPWSGVAALYRFDPPIEADDRRIEFAVISASTKPPGPPEVAVFPADAQGCVENIGDCLLKVRNTTDHDVVLLELTGTH